MNTKNKQNLLLLILFFVLMNIQVSKIAFGSCSLNIRPSILSDGDVGTPYSQRFTVIGAHYAFIFFVANGALPDGLTLNGSGLLSGTPIRGGNFHFTIGVKDLIGCTGSKSYDVGISPLQCTYEDLFNDDVVDWLVLTPNVSESAGIMNLYSNEKKAGAISPNTFAGCSMCKITAEISLSGGVQKAWMLTHRFDDNNQLEVQFKRGMIVIKQRSGGSILAKSKANFTFLPNIFYKVALRYDGSKVVLNVDGVQVLSFAPIGGLPSGIIGFQTKNGTLSVNRVCVN